MMPRTLETQVTRGAEIGIVMYPHRYADGTYVASSTRFKCDYRRVGSIDELIEYWRKGHSIRMSNPLSKCHRSPSLIAPASIRLLAI